MEIRKSKQHLQNANINRPSQQVLNILYLHFPFETLTINHAIKPIPTIT